MRLTSNLAIGPILSRPNIRKVAKRLAAREAARKFLNLAVMIDNSRLGADVGQTLKICIDAHHDFDVGWTLLDVLVSPLGDSVAQMARSLAATFFTEGQELIREDHAVSVYEHEDERITVLRKLLARVLQRQKVRLDIPKFSATVLWSQ